MALPVTQVRPLAESYPTSFVLGTCPATRFLEKFVEIHLADPRKQP